jgi:hypothetical protein
MSPRRSRRLDLLEDSGPVDAQGSREFLRSHAAIHLQSAMARAFVATGSSTGVMAAGAESGSPIFQISSARHRGWSCRFSRVRAMAAVNAASLALLFLDSDV